MKIKIKSSVLFFFIVSITASGLSYANADDTKWIAQCLMDNAKGQTTEVVQKYCECMNDKMDESETLSITQWEKTHPKEEKECDDKAGWK
ncbi:MAG: hypothetical protein ISR72_06820 [Methylobacter sp.]|nr:hypothetical protein [Planctomycetota bacterium]MBL6986739.1 hypothetical protein [Methylobacter sp.]